MVRLLSEAWRGSGGGAGDGRPGAGAWSATVAAGGGGGGRNAQLSPRRPRMRPETSRSPRRQLAVTVDHPAPAAPARRTWRTPATRGAEQRQPHQPGQASPSRQRGGGHAGAAAQRSLEGPLGAGPVTADGSGGVERDGGAGGGGGGAGDAPHRPTDGCGRKRARIGDEPFGDGGPHPPTPAAPSAPDLDAGSDSGTLDSDNLTNLARPHHRRQRGGGHAGAAVQRPGGAAGGGAGDGRPGAGT